MYYLNRNGTQSGPFTEGHFRSLLSTGQVLPTDLVWKEGDPEWQLASTLMQSPEFAPPAAGPPPMPGGGETPAAVSAYRPPSASLRQGPAQNVPTYLTQAILVTLLCCLPFGIPAIVYAASVSGKLQAGDYEGAKVASDKAKFWSWMSFWFALIPIGIAILGGAFNR
jgi:hypothetical protein